MPQFLHNLHAIRGLACVLVVVTHLGVWERQFGIRKPLLAWTEWFGYAAVDLFFVLSGFVITYTQMANLGKRSAFIGYTRARLWRVFPMFWMMLPLAVLQVHLVSGEPLTDPGSDRLGRWLSWIFLVPHHAMNPYLPTAWTLPFELFFYLLFGVLILFPRRLAVVALGIWAASAVFVPWVYGTETATWHPLFHAVCSPHVLEIVAGCGAAWLVRSGWLIAGRTCISLGVIWAATLVSVCNPHTVPMYLAVDPWGRALTFGVAGVLIVYGFVVIEMRNGWRFPGWTKPFGDASYSIYLGHIPACSLVFGTTFWWWPQHTGPHILWMLTMLAAGLGGGWMFYRLIERPLLKLGKRSKHREPTTIPESPVIITQVYRHATATPTMMS